MHKEDSKINLRQEIDPKLSELFGPIPNNEERLSQKEFITKEKAEECLNILKEVAIDDAIKRWGLLEKL